MSRYIDAEWVQGRLSLADECKDCRRNVDQCVHNTIDVGIVCNAIDDAPSIDIVRCAECVYCNIQNTKYLYAVCQRHGIEFKPFEDDTRTHGCTWGERKESE